MSEKDLIQFERIPPMTFEDQIELLNSEVDQSRERVIGMKMSRKQLEDLYGIKIPNKNDGEWFISKEI